MEEIDGHCIECDSYAHTGWCSEYGQSEDAPNKGIMLDLRDNGGRLFILKFVKEYHRKLKMGLPKSPTLAALERCIDLEDQLNNLKRIKPDV